MAFIEGWPHLRGGLYEGFHCSHYTGRNDSMRNTVETCVMAIIISAIFAEIWAL